MSIQLKKYWRLSGISLAAPALLAMALVTPARVSAEEDTPEMRLANATEAFREIMQTPDKGVSRDLLDKAECAVIIPGMKKGAFIVGVKYGRGFVTCRKGADRWGPPAGVKIEGGSAGFQIGGSSTDVFMLIMNQDGMKKLLSDKFTLGADASVAAGPVGRSANASTDAQLHAEILAWSRSRGLFAGVSLEGATLRPDTEDNEKLYGRKVSNEEILRGDVAMPSAARPLIAALNEYSGPAKSAARDQ